MSPLFAAVLAVVVSVAPGGHLKIVDRHGHVAQPYQRWADASKAPVPSGRVRIEPTLVPCRDPQADACSTPGVVYIEQPSRIAFVWELGHQFDYAALGVRGPRAWYANLSDPLRDGFRRIIGDRHPWWTPFRGQSGGEWFSDAYSHCALDGAPGAARIRTRFGGSWAPACSLIARVAVRERPHIGP